MQLLKLEAAEFAFYQACKMSSCLAVRLDDETNFKKKNYLQQLLPV